MANMLATGEFEPVASGIYLEGLAVDHQRNIVWYSDVIAGGVHGVMPDGEVVTVNPERMWTGGVMVNADGSVLSSGQGGIMWNNPDSGKSGWLVHDIGGKVINGVNEMVPDGTGGIYFGTNDIEMVIEGKTTRPTALYRLTVDREVVQVADGLSFTNGIMLSADRKSFYCNDTFACTWAFDVEADLSLSNKRVLLDREDVDGMALDAEGNVWITSFASGLLTRLKPNGTALSPVATPGGAVTQIRFAGEDMRDFYVNTVSPESVERIKAGDAIDGRDSILYRGRSEVPGQPVVPAQFRLG